MMLKAVFTAIVLFACTPYSSLGENEHFAAPQNLEVLMGGSIQAYHAPKAACNGFMPLAQCANRCTPDRTIDGAEDCTSCTLHRFMPPASCAQCSAERPCDSCFTYNLMPINECKIRPEYRPYKPTLSPTPSPSVPAYVAPPVPTPAATEAAESPPQPIPTAKPTTPAPTTQAPPTAAPTTEAPATEEPAYTTVYATTEAPPLYTTEAPTTEAPTTEEPSTEQPYTEGPYTEEPYTEAPEATLVPLPTYGPEGPHEDHDHDHETTESPGTYAAGNVAGTQSTGGATATSGSTSESESSELAPGEIAGIVIGCVAAVALVAFVAWKKTQDKQREEQMFGEPAELENPDSNSDYAAM